MTTTFTATRDQLVDAISCIELRVPLSGPMARKISAELLADAIIEALGNASAPDVAQRYRAELQEQRPPAEGTPS